jgi:hypothetical protein
LKLVSNQLNTPAKIDLTDDTYASEKAGKTDTFEGPYFLSSNIRIILSRRETEQRTTVAYTPLMLIADLANALGLFFGFSVISLYEAIEKGFLHYAELLFGEGFHGLTNKLILTKIRRRRCGLVVHCANSFTGGRTFDPEPRHPLSL